ncbi:hypothetical protein B7Z17_01935 [Candidatus Saccharibacteria bacterium 32-49-10]|nr:MAG: hypothetical protein B7Z17_01935 [Candidatus Saccharibacteria bacterium 32-49-10]
MAVVGFIGFLACAVWFIWSVQKNRDDFFHSFMPKVGHVIASIVVGLIAVAVIVGPLYWLYGTEPGQRELKSFASETGGGLERTVTVYDMQGEPIDSWTGKFDIQTEESKVFFDMPIEGSDDTRRVQIYNGTVIAEEIIPSEQ